MKLFSEEVRYTSTNSSHNVLQIENFSEIFFDVFEIEINKSKYPVEKISEHNGNPVVSVPVLVEGNEIFYPFILIKGKFELIFNENNTIANIFPDGDFEHIKEVPIVDNFLLEKDDDSFIEEIHITDLIDNKKDILLQIESAKKDASKAIQRDKVLKLKQLSEQSKKHNKALENTLEIARENLVNEFIIISDKLRKELTEDSHVEYSELKETLDNKLTIISENLESQLEDNFQNASSIFDNQIKTLVKELYSETVSPKVEKELNDIAFQIVEKVGEIETTLDKKLETKAEKTLVEGVSKEITAIQKANIELNDNINKGVNKALSRAGNVKILVEKIDKEINEKISDELTNIENYFEEKIQNITNQTYDITEESRKYIIDLVNKSKVELLEEIRKIPTEKPIEYIIESTKKDPEKVNLDKLKKEYDTIIHNKFENYKTDLRKYISVYSGGGSVAMQFADGGTMNGNLTVVGTISASQYLGIPSGEVSGDYLPLSGGTITGSVTANSFVTLNGLSSQFVKGDGSLDSNIYLTSEDLNSNVILFPTTTSSGISGYSLMVSSITDIAYDDPAVNVPTGVIDSIDTYISTIISREGVLIGDIDTINMTIIGKIRKTAGGTNKNATFHFHVYKRSADGTETSIGVSGDTLTVTASIYEEYSASVLLPASTWLSTDRLVLKLYGILIGSGGGANPQYQFEFGGLTPVRVLIPLPTSVQLSNYVPYIGSTKDIDLGIHTITASNLIYNGGNTNTSNLLIGTNDNYNLNLETGGVSRMTILSSGNVGIGTTTPASKLTVEDVTLAGSLALSGSALEVNQTWNTTGTPTALSVNVTDLSSNAASSLMDLKVGGSSKFKVNKDGTTTLTTLNGNSSNLFIQIESSSQARFIKNNSVIFYYPIVADNSFGIALRNNSASLKLGTSDDVVLTRDTSNTLAQRNGLNAQTFNIYNTYTTTPTTSYERGFFKWDNDVLKIGTEASGTTGVARNLEIGGVVTTIKAGTNRTITLNQEDGLVCNASIQTTANVFSTGGFYARTTTDNATFGNRYGLGIVVKAGNSGTGGNVGIGTATPASKLTVEDVTLAGSLALSGSALEVNQTWNTTGTPTALSVNVTDLSSNAASLLMDLKVGGRSKFNISKSGGLLFGPSTNPVLRASVSSDGAGRLLLNPSNISGIVVYGSTQLRGALNFFDGAFLQRDNVGENNVIAQRNGVNPQESRIYGTYANSGADYRRLALKMDTAGVAQIVAEGLGTGVSSNSLQFQANGTTRIVIDGTGVSLTGSTTVTGILSPTAIRSGYYIQTGTEFLFGTGGVSDVSLRRNSGGVVEVSNGSNSAGNLRDLSLRNLTASGDIEVTDLTKGIILKSPNGNRFRITVGDDGALTTTAL